MSSICAIALRTSLYLYNWCVIQNIRRPDRRKYSNKYCTQMSTFRLLHWYQKNPKRCNSDKGMQLKLHF